jgi:hypothetical protein
MTSSVDVIDPPTDVTLVPCTNQARYFCAKQIPGTIYNLDRVFLTLNNGFKKGTFTFFQLYKVYLIHYQNTLNLFPYLKLSRLVVS